MTSANHILGAIDYPDPPPVGGDHDPCWAKWGVHDDVVVPPENWVHNLEHGGVVFLYRASSAATAREAGASDAGAIAQIDALVQRLPRTLSTEYAALPRAFAVVAWGHRLVSDCFDPQAAEDFYAEHFNQAPEDIPDDPTCN